MRRVRKYPTLRLTGAVALVLCALPCFGQGTGKQRAPAARSAPFKQLLSWLPENTETAIVANGSFPFPDFDLLSSDPSASNKTSDEIELRIRSLPLGLVGLKNGRLSELVKGKTVEIALEGSRHFRPPTRLGEMKYEGCEIVQFAAGVSLDREAYTKSATSSAARFEEIASVRVAVFEETLENDIWTTYVAWPRNDLLLVATDATYLQAVLERIGRTTNGLRALPESLPEWKYVNTRASVWDCATSKDRRPTLTRHRLSQEELTRALPTTPPWAWGSGLSPQPAA